MTSANIDLTCVSMIEVSDDLAVLPGSPQPPGGALRVEDIAACPVCGGTGSETAFESRDLLHGIPGLYRYVRCRRCRTVYQNPRVRPEDIGACYPESYFTHEVTTPADVVAAGSLRDRVRSEILRRVDGGAAPPEANASLRAAGRVLALSGTWRKRARYGLLDPLGLRVGEARCLEIGPGRGNELLSLTRLGWQAIGLEVDPVAARSAQETSGCEVFAGRLADAPWPRETFDLIYASHVFEHMLDPVEELRAMWTLLRSGGRLVLVYPNPRSLSARAFGSLALTWDPPRHLFLAPRRAVRDCLTGVGYSEVRVAGLARRASNYAGRARQRRSATSRVRPWLNPRVVHIAETVGVALGLDIGEELLVTATRPNAETT